jgi:cell wall-associated NlpC family hydrolase
MALAAATTVAMMLPLTGVATADQKPGPNSGSSGAAPPSQAQVDHARAQVASKKKSVAQLESDLAAATARMESASVAAEAAAEAYNGAMWRLDEARTASSRAQLQAAQAAESVERQRSGIVTLVTDSYQNGTELNTATAMLSDEGPTGLMNRYAVVASAGDSMEARYDAFRVVSAQAKSYAARAAKARDHQKSLTAEAKTLAVAAGQAASAAGVAANQIADQKLQLLQAVAKAENISLDLATRRHDALDRIAKQKAAAAKSAKEAAAAAALAKEAKEARKRAAEAKPTRAPDTGGTPTGGPTSGPVTSPAPPPVANPAPNQAVAVQRAIAYAKAQLGKPYLWAASGPTMFDCSGLTMRAWGAAGVALPHYSVAQFAQSTRVSMADARPGDLLFWSYDGTPGAIHHVALYLGGGQFIEAPRTGLNVRYNSIYNWYPDFVARP